MRSRFLAIAMLMLVAAACASAPASTSTPSRSGAPDAVDAPTPSMTVIPSTTPASPPASRTQSPVASPTPRGAPSPASSPTGTSTFQYADVLSVQAESVAVRVAPSTSSRSMLAFREGQSVADAQLHRGDFVSVLMGPLPVGNDVWYLVRPAEDGRIGYSLTSWRPSGADGGTYPGWVTASAGTDHHFALSRRPAADEVLPEGPTLVAHGDADFVSPPMPRHDLFKLNWAVAATTSACDFSLRLVTEDGPEPVLAASVTTDTIAQGPLSGPGGLVFTEWAMEGEWSRIAAEVTSSCPWTFALESLGHD